MRVGVFVKPFDYRIHYVFEGGAASLINVGNVAVTKAWAFIGKTVNAGMIVDFLRDAKSLMKTMAFLVPAPTSAIFIIDRLVMQLPKQIRIANELMADFRLIAFPNGLLDIFNHGLA